MAQIELLKVIAGNTLTLDLQVLDRNKEPVTDLVGATGVFQIREECRSDLVIESTAYIDPATASVQITVPKEETAPLLPTGDMRKFYKYGARIEYSDGSTRTILMGRLMVTCGVVE